MFDIGFFELLIIGVVLLLVMGPERLPEVARQAAFVIKRVRAWIFQMKSEMNLLDDPIIDELKKTKSELNGFTRDLKQAGSDLVKGVDDGLMKGEVKKITQSPNVKAPDTNADTNDKPVSKKSASKKAVARKSPVRKKVAKKRSTKKVSKKVAGENVASKKR